MVNPRVRDVWAEYCAFLKSVAVKPALCRHSFGKTSLREANPKPVFLHSDAVYPFVAASDAWSSRRRRLSTMDLVRLCRCNSGLHLSADMISWVLKPSSYARSMSSSCNIFSRGYFSFLSWRAMCPLWWCVSGLGGGFVRVWVLPGQLRLYFSSRRVQPRVRASAIGVEVLAAVLVFR